MTFGQALEALKEGRSVSRVQEWCGGTHGVSIKMLAPVGVRPFIAIRTGSGEWAPWLPQQFDLLAEDWTVVPDGR